MDFAEAEQKRCCDRDRLAGDVRGTRCCWLPLPGPVSGDCPKVTPRRQHPPGQAVVGEVGKDKKKCIAASEERGKHQGNACTRWLPARSDAILVAELQRGRGELGRPGTGMGAQLPSASPAATTGSICEHRHPTHPQSWLRSLAIHFTERHGGAGRASAEPLSCHHISLPSRITDPRWLPHALQGTFRGQNKNTLTRLASIQLLCI